MCDITDLGDQNDKNVDNLPHYLRRNLNNLHVINQGRLSDGQKTVSVTFSAVCYQPHVFCIMVYFVMDERMFAFVALYLVFQ